MNLKMRPAMVLCAAFGLCFAGRTVAANESQPGDSRPSGLNWRFSAGAAARSLGGVKFNTGSYSQPSDIPLILGGGKSSTPFGPATGFADRTYNEGFVFRDINTEDPNSFLPGTTAYFGYARDSQIQNGNLLFSGAGYSTSAAQHFDSTGRQTWDGGRSQNATPTLQLNVSVPVTKALDLGLQLGYMYISSEANHTTSTFSGFQSLTRTDLTVTDSYDLQGIVLPLAPYAGVFNPPGPAPLINNVPTQRQQTATSTVLQSIMYGNRVDEKFSLRMHTLSLGANIEGKWRCLSMSVSPGIGFNIVDWSADSREQLFSVESGHRKSVREWSNRTSGTDLLPSFYLQGEIGFQATRYIRLSAFFRYDWAEALNGTVGRSQFHQSLDGQTIGGALSFTF